MAEAQTRPPFTPGVWTHELAAGSWSIGPVSSMIGFAVRHLMVSTARGQFGRFEGRLQIAPEISESTVEVTVWMASVDAGEALRNEFLRTSDFLDVQRYPVMHFRSTSVTPKADDEFLVAGELTLRGITRQTSLRAEFLGVVIEADGTMRAGFTATSEINRRDFGIEFDKRMDGGGVILGDKIQITLDVKGVREIPV